MKYDVRHEKGLDLKASAPLLEGQEKAHWKDRMDHSPPSAASVRKTVSDILVDIAGQGGRERITLGDLAAALEDRAYGALLLLFAFPVVIPNPVPGLTSIFGLPLAVIAVQMALGFPRPKLPAFIAARSIPAESFGKMVRVAVPWLKRAEKVLRPRFSIVTSKLMERLIALFCVLLAVVVAMPIPLSNGFPATAICLIALGLFERDGLFVLLGVVSGGAAVALVWTVIVAFFVAAFHFIGIWA